MKRNKRNAALWVIALFKLYCLSLPLYAVSDITLDITDFAQVIDAKASADGLNKEDAVIEHRAIAHFKQRLDELKKTKKNQKAKKIETTETNSDEMNLLLDICEQLLKAETLARNQRDMLIQQAELIIKKNTASNISGEDVIRSYYLFAKTINHEAVYGLLSPNAQYKLPLNGFKWWWTKTVVSVAVKKVDNLGSNQYNVWLLYDKNDQKQQCSKDLVEIVNIKQQWFINDFSWSEVSVTECLAIKAD